MNFLRYMHVYYFIVTWLFAFIVIRPKRIKELFPISFISMVILAFVNFYIVTLGLYKYYSPVVNVFGVPGFHIFWGAGAGLIFIHYMKPGFISKFLTVVFFTIVTLALEFIAEKAGVSSRLGDYTVIHSFFLDFSTLVVLLWISEGLYGDRIYKNRK